MNIAKGFPTTPDKKHGAAWYLGGVVMKCKGCGNENLIQIRLSLGDDRVSLHRCADCDVRAWVGPQGAVGIDRVLELARAAH